VGYGDYSPVTVLGRLFIIIFIVAGVAFFSIETGNLMGRGLHSSTSRLNLSHFCHKYTP